MRQRLLGLPSGGSADDPRSAGVVSAILASVVLAAGFVLAQGLQTESETTAANSAPVRALALTVVDSAGKPARSSPITLTFRTRAG